MTSLIAQAKRVAFQGEAGAFGNQAAREAVPHAEAVPQETFEDAIEAVRSGATDLCIIPIENALHGRIADIHHLLPDAGLHIVGEHFLRINLQLLGLKGAPVDGVRTIFSQGPALGQCRKLIRELKLHAQEWHDTAGSARHVAELNDPTVAAVASALAGELYGLEVLRRDVEDEPHNMTRFLIMSRTAEEPAPHGDATVMTSLVFRVRNVPAALYKAMGGFATNGVNMTKLESYQVGGTFTATQFYAEIEGHPEDRPVRLALEELQFFSSQSQILGVYPAHALRAVAAAGAVGASSSRT
ncbi:Bifunctional chorismate mutase/prephenate dehydratase [Alphaproteobacteria bacterium SO-S41]|nr:Bifunctional chorismate mutase/prephenate dehydratase [Alphaproteobacteria bacterium SO-S41]